MKTVNGLKKAILTETGKSSVWNNTKEKQLNYLNFILINLIMETTIIILLIVIIIQNFFIAKDICGNQQIIFDFIKTLKKKINE